MENSKIFEIAKSWKYEGYCIVTESISLKTHKRKIYSRKSGINYINLNNEVYSFTWNGEKAQDIKLFGSYKNIAEAIKATEKAGTEIPDENKKIEEFIEAKIDGNKPVKHIKFMQIKVCVENKIPVYLAGPAGSGKNHTLENIAEELGLDFYFTNSVQQEYKLTGFIDAGGKYHETEFYRAFVNGGLFFLDEMDASIPEVLVLLNAAIANGYFEFPTGKVTAHEDFRVVAAGNTVGNGADEQYTGRLVLDQATLDHFVIIEFDYDKNIEIHLAKGNMELVEFVNELRSQAKAKGIRCTFSYRCIMMVRKLEDAIALEEVLKIAVFKGLDKSTINTFTSANSANKYFGAMMRVQR